jgi:hypothetical protein
MAAAMDPHREGLVRQILIATVKQMDPFDVLVLRKVWEGPGANWTPSGRDFMSSALGASQDEVLVSFDNLERLNLISFAISPHINPFLPPLGRVLMRAVQ